MTFVSDDNDKFRFTVALVCWLVPCTRLNPFSYSTSQILVMRAEIDMRMFLTKLLLD